MSPLVMTCVMVTKSDMVCFCRGPKKSRTQTPVSTGVPTCTQQSTTKSPFVGKFVVGRFYRFACRKRDVPFPSLVPQESHVPRNTGQREREVHNGGNAELFAVERLGNTNSSGFNRHNNTHDSRDRLHKHRQVSCATCLVGKFNPRRQVVKMFTRQPLHVQQVACTIVCRQGTQMVRDFLLDTRTLYARKKERNKGARSSSFLAHSLKCTTAPMSCHFLYRSRDRCRCSSEL